MTQFFPVLTIAALLLMVAGCFFVGWFFVTDTVKHSTFRGVIAMLVVAFLGFALACICGSSWLNSLHLEKTVHQTYAILTMFGVFLLIVVASCLGVFAPKWNKGRVN